MSNVAVHDIMAVLDANKGRPGEQLNEIRALCDEAPEDEVEGDTAETPVGATGSNPEPAAEGATAGYSGMATTTGRRGDGDAS